MPDQPSTRNEAVFQRIRADILSGELPPGSRLRFAEMRKRYDTSVGVVREALSRIAEQGLARSEPQLGFSVAPVSTQGLRELTDTRCDIEGLVFKYAVRDAGLEWESSILAAHHTLDRTPMRVDGHFNDDWARAHKAFHHALLAGCPNRRLLAIALSLRDAAEFYRRAAQRPVGHGVDRDVAVEHAELLRAGLARDEEAAVSAIVHHIRATTDYLLENAHGLDEGSSAALA